MPITDCQPCNCIAGNIPNERFKQDVEVILCGILDALGGGVLSITPLADKTIAFGSIGASFGVTGFVDANKEISSVTVANGTNGTIAISYDGTNTWFTVAAGGSRTIDFGAGNLTVATDLYIKHTTAVSSGSVILSGWYTGV